MIAVKIATPTETRPGERRVAMVPDASARLVAAGWEVAVQAGAGTRAHFADQGYIDKGASVHESPAELYGNADVVAKVQPPAAGEAEAIPEGAVLVSMMQPAQELDTLKVLSRRRVTAFSLDLLPRISRAQSMDALSSQATVSGYRGALDAAERLAKFFPMFMTAAGTVPPAKVLVLGAGVAGLQAIATARRLGAQVRAYDVRAAAKEEVASLGATFVELPIDTQEGAGGYAKEQSEELLARQRELIASEVAAADAVITTAAIPGKRAPVLITKEMVGAMAGGSVVIDLAADSGGNCELSEPGVEALHGDVLVCGISNPPSSMPTHASFLYARNIANFAALLVSDGKVAPNFDDEIVSGSCVLRQGEPFDQVTVDLLGRGAK